MAEIQTTSSGVEITTDSYNGNDELQTETDATNGTVNYTTNNTYDNNGSLISSTTNGQTTTYTYDVRNKMVGYSSGSTSATYVYDDAGDRVQETVSGITTFYLTDTQNPTGYDQPIERWTSPDDNRSDATIQTTYILGSSVIAQVTSGGTVSYLLTDGHGSTRALTSSSGVITSNGGVIFDYDAFGDALNFNPATAGTIFLFGGDAVYDPVSGLYMNGDGTRDRLGFEFIQMDSNAGVTIDPLSLHKYLYANADPINGRDPSGHDDSSDPYGVLENSAYGLFQTAQNSVMELDQAYVAESSNLSLSDQAFALANIYSEEESLQVSALAPISSIEFGDVVEKTQQNWDVFSLQMEASPESQLAPGESLWSSFEQWMPALAESIGGAVAHWIEDDTAAEAVIGALETAAEALEAPEVAELIVVLIFV